MPKYNLSDSTITKVVIIAYLQLKKGKATLSDFNKIYCSLGNTNITRRGYNDLFDKIKQNTKYYNDLFDEVYTDKISLADLPNSGTHKLNNDSEVYDILTTYNKQHQLSQDYLREYRRAIKDGSTLELLMDSLKDSLLKELKSLNKTTYVSEKVTQVDDRKHIIVCLADWHVGALVDNVETGGYDYKLLKERLDTFYEEVKNAVISQHVTDIHVYHIGDLIEHIAMRNVNQAFDTEFTMAEQIAKGIRLLIEFLNRLGGLGKVTFGCVGGNHDRLNGNKKDQVYNDSAMYIALSQILLVKSMGLLPNVTVMDNRNDIYYLEDQVGVKNILVEHGDREKKANDVKIPSHIKDHSIDYLIMGHIHTTRIIQEDYSRFNVYVGSPMGANNYSKELNMPDTAPSQMIMVLNDRVDSPIFQPVFL
jgi:predicted phosphodiesterase